MSSLNYTSHSDEHFDRIHYYSPLIPPVKPRKKELNTELKIALIGSDRLYNGFRFEADVFLLTEENWKEALKYLEFDFLLVESCLESTTGHWEYAQIEGSEKNQKLKNLVEFAKEKSIPTVYWFTQDHVYHDNYKVLASMFEHIFCADIQEVVLLKDEGVAAEVLLPSVQPALFNPIRENEYYNALDISVLFDGWSDLYRFEEQLKVLQDIKPYGLKIIDSKKEIFKNKLKEFPEYIDEILGSVSQESRRTLLKYSKTVISFDESLLTPTSQQWDALEVAATRANLLHRGRIEDYDIRKNIVIETKTDSELLLVLTSFEEDDLYRERLAHKSWRRVNQKHTFNHRLRTIVESLKIKIKNSTHKKASIITPTYRASHMMQSIKTYQQQTYKHKELILIYNGSDLIPEEVNELCQNYDDITLVKLPPEKSVGACLNLGHNIAAGVYCFRVDDDDMYAPNYILDMMLHLNYTDTDIFGRPPGYISFEETEGIYIRNNQINPLSFVKSKDILNGLIYLGGNTIGGKRSFLLCNIYPEQSFGAADTSFILNVSKKSSEILILDLFNMLVIRRPDLSSHTWRLSSEKIQRNLIRIDINKIEDIYI